MATSQPQNSLSYHQQNVALVREKLNELGLGPFTPEQLKLRDSYLHYLSKDTTMAANSQGLASAGAATTGQQATVLNPSDPSNLVQANVTAAGASTATAAASVASSSSQNQILDKRALQELVKEVDPSEQLDEDVEDMLLQIADDFIENIINSSCQLAKHRKSNILEAKDVQFHLERNYNLWIPGFGTDELKPYKKNMSTEAHKQRLQLIKKSSAKPGDAKSSNS